MHSEWSHMSQIGPQVKSASKWKSNRPHDLGPIWQGPIWLRADLTGADLTWGRFDLLPVWFQTSIGLPQGSVISPILFNIFIKDIFNNITADHCKFADDATIWHTEENRKLMESKLQEDLNQIKTWTGAVNGEWNSAVRKPNTAFFLEIRKKKKSSI